MTTAGPFGLRRGRLSGLFVSRDLARRDLALDALRGLMILGMILVNHAPPVLPTYAALVHAEWHGWTLADTIFAGFLFAVGVSIGLTLCDDAGSPRPPDAARYRKIVRRFGILMILNFLLINFPYYFAATPDFTGTLALIAWCSLLVSLVVLHTDPRARFAILAGALLLQWAAFDALPLPGAAAGTMTPEVNAARYLDGLLFSIGPPRQGGHILLMGLPTLGAFTTTLIGVLGAPLFARRGGSGAVARGLLVGLALCALGWAWDRLLPINKTLWTGSYSILMSGIAMSLFVTLRWIAERGERSAWIRPLQVAGANALFLYLFAQCLQRLLVYGRVRDEAGVAVRLRYYIHEHYVAPVLSGEFGSLVYALLFLLVCYAVALVLFRRRIFVKL